MRRKCGNSFLVVALSLCMLCAFALFTQAQQTLGGITGTVMESTGSVLAGDRRDDRGRRDHADAHPDQQRERKL